MGRRVAEGQQPSEGCAKGSAITEFCSLSLNNWEVARYGSCSNL